MGECKVSVSLVARTFTYLRESQMGSRPQAISGLLLQDHFHPVLVDPTDGYLKSVVISSPMLRR